MNNQYTYRVGIGAPVETIRITNYREEGVPGPDTYASLCWLQEKGFQLTMWCFEEEPLAVYRKGQAMGNSMAGSKKYLYQVRDIYNGSSQRLNLPLKF